jgi:hypothetical protein
MFEQQNENSSWNFNLQSSDFSNNTVYTEMQGFMSDPRVWDSVRRSMDAGQNQSMNGFPSSEFLLGDLNDSTHSREVDLCKHSDSKDNFLETAIKAPALLLDTWKEISGIKMAEQMVLSVLQNPEAMKLAVMAVQTGMFV